MADRPRLRSIEYVRLHPNRLVVIRDEDPDGYPEWVVFRGQTDLSAHHTHAEAITAAHKLAHDTAPRVWTTPDSGTQADYSLANGSA